MSDARRHFNSVTRFQTHVAVFSHLDNSLAGEHKIELPGGRVNVSGLARAWRHVFLHDVQAGSVEQDVGFAVIAPVRERRYGLVDQVITLLRLSTK